MPTAPATGRFNDATLNQMQSLIARWEGEGDHRCVFLACYALMTSSMIEALQAGPFLDRAWVDGLLRGFANYYFDALDGYERGLASVPAVWAHAHDAARTRAALPVEDLLLGINAHINYDLPLALVDALRGQWADLTAEERSARHADYTLVNDVIHATTARVQHEVVDRFDRVLERVDRYLAPVVRLADWEVGAALSLWRAEVWTHAVALLDAPTESGREAVSRTIADSALLRSRLILSEAALRHRLIAAPLHELEALRSGLKLHHPGFAGERA